MGLTSNQIASLGNIIPIANKEQTSPTTVVSSLIHESNNTQSFDNFQNEYSANV